MEIPLSHSEDPPAQVSTGEDGRHPPHGNRSFQGFRELKGMRKSTRYGILLYLLHSKEWSLSDSQQLWIIYYSRKFSETELLRAAMIQEKLELDSLFFQRMKHDIQETHVRVPRLSPLQLKEKRRIGIGYRDKGALRPLHQKREIGGLTVWDEDIQFLLPLDYEVQGRWISAEEVSSLIGVNLLNEVLYQIEKQTLSALPLLSKYSRTRR
jgi:hypothetical protein